MMRSSSFSRRAFFQGGAATLACAAVGCGPQAVEKGKPPMWRELYDSLEHRKCEEGREPATCSDAVLDECEAALAFRLPTSYRHFMKTFGPGEIFEYFKIYGPGFSPRDPRREQLDLTALTERRRKLAKKYFDFYDDSALAARLITFCSTLDGHQFGWDPQEKPSEHDYGPDSSVYVFPRLQKRIPRAAKTFQEFIVDYCQNGRDVKHLGGKPWQPKKSFWPFCKPIA